MKDNILEKLLAQGLLSQKAYDDIESNQKNQPVSLYFDLNLLLYLGIILLCTGLGIAVYKNIDSIGHLVVLIFILLICTGSFIYSFKKKLTYSKNKVESPGYIFDYILMLACLSFILLIGYAEHQYNILGEDVGLSLFVTMLSLFFIAYYFDHAGILSLAITNLAAWMGITVTPYKILSANDLTNSHIIYTIFVLGIFLIVCTLYSIRINFKAHFAFVYRNFGAHFLFISCLAGMMHIDNLNLVWLLILAGIAWFFYNYAIKERSFYYLLITALYSYIGISYYICYWFSKSDASINLICLYFIFSAVAFIFFLVHTNKRIKYDSL